MKTFLLLGLILAASTVTVAAAPVGQVSVSSTSHAVGARPEIKCGFICDSFGRCRRVCW